MQSPYRFMRIRSTDRNAEEEGARFYGVYKERSVSHIRCGRMAFDQLFASENGTGIFMNMRGFFQYLILKFLATSLLGFIIIPIALLHQVASSRDR